MRQLRPQISEADYLSTVRRMMQTDGYLQAAVFDGDAVVAVLATASWRCSTPAKRSTWTTSIPTTRAAHAVTAALMDWLKREARERGCVQLQLDSGVQREQTHRFYFREGLTINCYHFRVDL